MPDCGWRCLGGAHAGEKSNVGEQHVMDQGPELIRRQQTLLHLVEEALLVPGPRDAPCVHEGVASAAPTRRRNHQQASVDVVDKLTDAACTCWVSTRPIV